MTIKQVYAIEGLDRLGKSSLIEGIKNRLGFYQTIHFSKPEKLDAYDGAEYGHLRTYQEESFRNSMLMVNSGARLVFDRWHLGECVYAPLYRGYSGNYVFNLEKNFNLDENHSIRLILLTEDFECSKHFVDDGQSLGAIEKREEEQALFIEAFHRSSIPDKRIICVTDRALGGFWPKQQVLEEALA